MSERRDALSTAKGLTGALGAVGEELKRLNQYGRQSRRLVWLSFGSIALDLCLTFLLVFAYGAAHSAHSIATAEHQSVLSGCKAGNQTRAAEVTLWTHLASVASPPPHLTKRELARNRREVAQLLAYIRHTFYPRDCAKLYKLPGS